MFWKLEKVQWLYLAIIFLCLSGCRNLPLKTHVPDSISAELISSISDSAVFSVDPGESRVALDDNGTVVVSLATGERLKLDSMTPEALAWSPDGTRLAASFGNQNSTSIKVFNNSGAVTENTTIKGHTGSIFWLSDNELVITTNHTTEHKFGTSLRQDLHRWKLKGEATTTVLHETTLTPRTIKLYGISNLLGRFPPKLSPLNDELLFVRINNPPLSPADYRLYVKNIASGVEQEISRLAIDKGSALFRHDGEMVTWSDGSGIIWQQRLWDKGLPEKLPFVGNMLELSRDDAYRITDGILYRNEQRIAEIPSDSSSSFLASNRIMTVWKNSLYHLKGLAIAGREATLTYDQKERLKAVRSWRASGLITAEEYRKAQQRIRE